MRVENTLQVTSALRSSRKFVNSSLESLKEGQKRTYGTSEFIGDGTNAPLHALPYAARSPLAYGSNRRYEYGGLRGSPTNAPSPRLSHRLSVLQPSHALPP